jgi:signal transduction histidine kinase
MSWSEWWLKLRRGEGQTQADWALCLVRWGLLGCILLLALLDPSHRLSPSFLVFFVLGFGAYNLTITVLLTLEFLARPIPAFTLIADTIAFVLLIQVSGGVESPFFFLPLFPILTSVVRFGWLAGMLATGVFVASLAFRAALSWEGEQGAAQVFPAIVQTLMLALAAATGGALSMWPAADEQPEAQASVPENMKTFFEMASSLSATLNYERVLESVLDISRLGFDELGHRMGESSGLVLLHDTGGLLSVASHRNLVVSEDAEQRIPGKAGIVEQAIASAKAVVGGAPASDPELRVFKSLAPCQSMICVPLRAGFETYGVVLFASTRPNVYTAEHVDLLTIFCNQATIALQNADLYQSLREERDKIIDKEEQARHRLARDLHDGPTQDVSAIAMRLNFARLLVERNPVRAKAELARLEDLAHRTVREIRTMLFTLRPVVLETEGLVAALNEYASNLQQTNGLTVKIDAERYRNCLDAEAEGVVFAIIEEAVNNAKKHAEASSIWVRLKVERGFFVVQVEDDGCGFDVKAVERSYGARGSLGLVNLRERADLVDGSLTINSTPGEGTEVSLVVPLVTEAV